jgi:dTDP-4-dehydrorhamnose reductase
MRKILLFGKYGQIGSELTKLLSPWNLVSLGKNDVDILDHKAVEEAFNIVRPEIVINTVAYNDVDGAELYPDLAMRVNAFASGFLAKLSVQHNASYITYSSDFVFDGRKTTPYLEADMPNPINKYGESKLRGDISVQNSGGDNIILRTSSVYSLTHPCFLTRIIRQAKEKNAIPVRSDLVSSPTSAQFIAQATAFLIRNCHSQLHLYTGLYNLCSSGYTSRYQWAKAIQKSLDLSVRIVRLEKPAQDGAPRPAYSALNNQLFQRTFDMEIPNWDDMLSTLLEK